MPYAQIGGGVQDGRQDHPRAPDAFVRLSPLHVAAVGTAHFKQRIAQLTQGAVLGTHQQRFEHVVPFDGGRLYGIDGIRRSFRVAVVDASDLFELSLFFRGLGPNDLTGGGG